MLDQQQQLEAAMSMAIAAHREQRDKSGAAYIEHLLSVMNGVDCPVSRQVAVLHDILEDTDTTREDLMSAGITEETITAVELLTKPDSVAYEDYVVRLKANPIARKVKFADLRDNYRIDRVAFREAHAEEDIQRIMKYILSFQYLSDQIDEATYRRRMKSNG
jgi:(p)ppGpp synthase/HD superfamily hydrolase